MPTCNPSISIPLGSKMDALEIASTIWDSSDYNPTDTFSSLLFFCPKVIYFSFNMIGYVFSRLMQWNADSALIFALYGRLSSLSTNENTLPITALVQALIQHNHNSTYDCHHISAKWGNTPIINQSISTIDQASEGQSWDAMLTPLFDIAWRNAKDIYRETLTLSITSYKILQPKPHSHEIRQAESTLFNYTFTTEGKTLNISKPTAADTTTYPVTQLPMDKLPKTQKWLDKLVSAIMTTLTTHQTEHRRITGEMATTISRLNDQLSAQIAKNGTLLQNVSDAESAFATLKTELEESQKLLEAKNRRLLQMANDAKNRVVTLEAQHEATLKRLEESRTLQNTVLAEANALLQHMQA